jgi:hypothetical protein
MTEDGLSDRDKELRRWNAPYRYQEHPKMLYRGMTTAGIVTLEQRVVGSAGEEALALGAGWLPQPDRARQVALLGQAALGAAAAERAWDDRHLSPAAQAEAAAVDQATARHLPEIPEAAKRSHRRKEPRDG